MSAEAGTKGPPPVDGVAALSGNEAIARGAWEAGVRVAAAYPGTPSTEILEALAGYPAGEAPAAFRDLNQAVLAAGFALAEARARGDA